VAAVAVEDDGHLQEVAGVARLRVLRRDGPVAVRFTSGRATAASVTRTVRAPSPSTKRQRSSWALPSALRAVRQPRAPGVAKGASLSP
jgi:hypothetical protein